MDRQPAVAGQFYPHSPEVLEETVKELFKQGKPKEVENVLAVISPHAGYVFSGEVAASSFNQIEVKDYDNIFLIGSSHRVYLKGASIFNQGDCIIPGARIKVNTDLATELIKKYDFFEYFPSAHSYEHSLEVQLPFLAYKLKGKNYKVVPIIIGTHDTSVIRQIADALKPYFNEKNLFVISTDFSHYPSYEDAIINDSITADAIISNNPENLLKILKENEHKDIPNLATSLCGWSAVLTLLYITSSIESIKFKKIDYKNSGDSPYGDKYQVVGYFSIVAYKEQDKLGFDLTEEDKRKLLEIARQTLNEYITQGKIPYIDTSKISDNLRKKLGAFVTLHKNGKLRGCIGRFLPDEPLYKVVQDMTIAAATQDSRFEPVKTEELNDIKIEISVLTPLQKVKDPLKEIKIGRDGIYIRKGFYSGTLLPQVATENNWSVEEFLGYCSKYKAGLGWDGWKDKDAEVYKYQAIIFEEKDKK